MYCLLRVELKLMDKSRLNRSSGKYCQFMLDEMLQMMLFSTPFVTTDLFHKLTVIIVLNTTLKDCTVSFTKLSTSLIVFSKIALNVYSWGTFWKIYPSGK